MPRSAKFMMDHSAKSIAKASAAEHYCDTTFCVGTSPLNPANPFMDIWYRVNRRFPDYRLHPEPESIPVNRDHSIPYDLLYNYNAPEDVRRFVDEAAGLSEMSDSV